MHAKKNTIPYLIVDTKKRNFEKIILKEIKKYKISLICLAGYMKIISKNFINNCGKKIINIHPSLLPKFGGKGFFGRKVHQAVLDSGDLATGATVHLVNEEYDSGKILGQVEVPVKLEDSIESLEKRVKLAEKKYLIEILQALWQ